MFIIVVFKTTFNFIVKGLVANIGCSGLPNFLLLVGDDIGYNDVSWNNKNTKTPELESLAREGVILGKP